MQQVHIHINKSEITLASTLQRWGELCATCAHKMMVVLNARPEPENFYSIEFSGGPSAPRLFGNLVTPNELARTYGPPVGNIYVPRLGGTP